MKNPDEIIQFIEYAAQGGRVNVLANAVSEKNRQEAKALEPVLENLFLASQIDAPGDLKAKIKEQFIVNARGWSKGRSRSVVLFSRLSYARKSIAVLAALFILSMGTAMASTSAMPDSVLYPLKRAIESVSKTVAGQQGRALQVLAFNERRIAEIKYLQQTGDPQGIGQLVKEINLNIKELRKLMRGLGPEQAKKVKSKLDKFESGHASLLKPERPEANKGSGNTADTKNVGKPSQKPAGGTATVNKKPAVKPKEAKAVTPKKDKPNAGANSIMKKPAIAKPKSPAVIKNNNTGKSQNINK